jgi:integrase
LFSAASTAIAIATTASMLCRDFDLEIHQPRGVSFAGRTLDRIHREDVDAFMVACRRNGQAVKSTLNYVGLRHGIFDHAIRRGCASNNPCKGVDKPKPDRRRRHPVPRPRRTRRARRRYHRRRPRPRRVRAVPHRRDDRMRQRDLLALRWGDVEWSAQRIRVRRNVVRGELGTPKSKCSSRSVPLADALGGAGSPPPDDPL